MNPKAFIGLCVVTICVVVAAIAEMTNQYGRGAPARIDAPVVPGLMDQANDISEIVVRTHDETFTLKKLNKAWVMPEKGGYAVSEEPVRKALIDFARLRLSEPKTRKADRYARLELEDVDSKDAQSTLVTLKIADKEITKLILGKRKTTVSGKGRVGVYVREPGEAQAWFASGELSLKPTPTAWLQKALVDIDAKRIREIRIETADKGELVLANDTPKVKKLTIVNLPEDAKLDKTAAEKLKNLSDAFASLDLGDVKPAPAVGLRAADYQATVRTFNGLVLDVNGVKVADTTWFTFVASVDLAVSQDQTDPTAEAEAINERVSGWAYALSTYRTAALNVGLGDLMEK